MDRDNSSPHVNYKILTIANFANVDLNDIKIRNTFIQDEHVKARTEGYDGLMFQAGEGQTIRDVPGAMMFSKIVAGTKVLKDKSGTAS